MAGPRARFRWPEPTKDLHAGTPGDPDEFNPALAEADLRHVAATVERFNRYGIYTLLDMDQDVYNVNFRGEGAPDWAVCTDGVPIVPTGGRWSNNSRTRSSNGGPSLLE